MYIELCSSNATEKPSISTLAASVEAPYLHLHSPLLTSIAGLSSWSLVLVSALIATGATRMTGSYHLVSRTIYEKIVYMYKNIVYVQSPVEYVWIYECEYTFVRTLYDVRMVREYRRVLWTLNRRHLAHPVSVPILPRRYICRSIQALWSQNHDTAETLLVDCNAVNRVDNEVTERRTKETQETVMYLFGGVNIWMRNICDVQLTCDNIYRYCT